MNRYIVMAALALTLATGYAHAESIPDWVRSNAGWWAQGQIDDGSFVQSIQYLIGQGIIVVPPTAVSAEGSDVIPEWVKSNAGWWAQGQIADSEFANAIAHLIKEGIIAVDAQAEAAPADVVQADMAQGSSSEMATLEAELAACEEIYRISEKLDCQKAVKQKMTVQGYMQDAKSYEVGPVTFYWMGLDSEGNSFEISPSGQALLTVRMLAQNTGSSDNVAMMCTGPAVCNYDISDGSKSFKYASMDFTSGQLVLKPGDAREFNMLFGPSIGYGGNAFEYDASKEYHFVISEPWGKAKIPLELG